MVPVFAYIIEDAFHSNIREHGLLGVSRLGPIHPERCNEIVSQSVKRFFDQYLKGDSQEDFEEWAETEEELVRTNRIITRPRRILSLNFHLFYPYHQPIIRNRIMAGSIICRYIRKDTQS